MTPAARTAARIEALGGWTVERLRPSPGVRVVRAARGAEVVEFEWRRNPTTGRDLVQHGVNVAATLRAMAEPIARPLAELDDGELLSLVAGHEIVWRTGHGLSEADVVPRGGPHLRVEHNPSGRAVAFVGTRGYRSVMVSAIVRVKR